MIIGSASDTGFVSHPRVIEEAEGHDGRGHDRPDAEEAVFSVHVTIHDTAGIGGEVFNEDVGAVFIEVDDEVVKPLTHPKNEGNERQGDGSLEVELIA